jgi:hypothetical protein
MAATKGKDGGKRPNKPEGQLRQSQLVTTFGPGARVDLVDRAVVIGGLEHWGFPHGRWVALDDARLRRSLRPRLKALDPDLDLAADNYFRMPPAGDGRDPFPGVGVRALEFPRWFVCQRCRRLSRAPEGFENKGGRYVHECADRKHGAAIPVRFVVACKRGHLGDFPWVSFAHMGREGGACDAPTLFLQERSLGDVAQIIVECRTCGSSLPMSHASALPFKCGGDRPWLGGRAMNEPCTERQELLVRTASNAYFAQVVSAIRLPDPAPDPLRLRLRQKDVWAAVQNITTEVELGLVARLMPHVAAATAGRAPSEVLAAIQAENAAANDTAKEAPLRSAEYQRLMGAPIEVVGAPPDAGVEFAAYRVPRSRVDLPAGVGGLVVVPEMREVRVQVSFSRFDSVSANLQGEFDLGGKLKPAVLTLPNGNQKWLPAAEVRGEGVFVELDPDALAAWEARPAVKERAERLLRAHLAGDTSPFPGLRFYLLHSLSHLLLTAVSLECGYAASSIRERIYCGQAEQGGPDMAAIMLMTGTTGSEGTLGGLVEEGRRIRHHLREAWDLGRLCSNDPVCAAHDPSSEASDRRTEGAACHGCLYIAECSCEWFNRRLDRALVVPTIGNDPELAFFRERP